MARVSFNSSILTKTLDRVYISQLQADLKSNPLTSFITNYGLTTSEFHTGWVGGAPWPLKREGRREHQRLESYTHTITPVDWGRAIDIDLNDLHDDQTGQLSQVAQGMARRNADHMQKRAIEFLEAGGATTYGNAYTGTTFFSNSHSDNGHSWDNNLAATGTPGSITAAQIETAVKAAEKAMIVFPDDQGVPVDEDASNFVHMFHNSMYSEAAEVFGDTGMLGTNQQHAADSSGLVGARRGRAWFFHGLLSSNAKMYTFRVPRGANVNALSFVNREAWKVRVKTPETSDYCDDNKCISIVDDARYEMGYGDPRLCALTTFS